jgi:predicted amidohydrolase YtcJ
VLTNNGAFRLQVDQLLIEWVAPRRYISVHDAGGLVGPAFGPCQDLVETGQLKLRIYAFATVNSLQHAVMGRLGAGVRSGLGDERLKIGAFKVVTVCSSSGPTAAPRAPYASNSQDCGILYWDQDGLDALLRRAHRQGFQCTAHAVGDRTIE